MRFYGYLRASTKEQDANRAKTAISEFAASLNIIVTAFFTENETGTILSRPELIRLLDICAPGDAIVIESIDRLTRLNESDWQTLKSKLSEKQIRIIAIDVPTTHSLVDTNDEITGAIMRLLNNLIIDLMAIFARKDYELRKERQRQGVQKAKALGKYKGRPRNKERREKIGQLLLSTKTDGSVYSWTEIQQLTGCSRGLIASVQKELKANNQLARNRGLESK